MKTRSQTGRKRSNVEANISNKVEPKKKPTANKSETKGNASPVGVKKKKQPKISETKAKSSRKELTKKQQPKISETTAKTSPVEPKKEQQSKLSESTVQNSPRELRKKQQPKISETKAKNSPVEPKEKQQFKLIESTAQNSPRELRKKQQPKLSETNAKNSPIEPNKDKQPKLSESTIKNSPRELRKKQQPKRSETKDKNLPVEPKKKQELKPFESTVKNSRIELRKKQQSKVNERKTKKSPLELGKKQQETKSPSKTKKSPRKALRDKKNINYFESTLEESTTCDEKTPIKKLPIYKQLDNETPVKRKVDQYEFDSDSEKSKKKKRRKISSDSKEYVSTLKTKVAKPRKKTKTYADKENKKLKKVLPLNDINQNNRPLKSQALTQSHKDHVLQPVDITGKSANVKKVVVLSDVVLKSPTQSQIEDDDFNLSMDSMGIPSPTKSQPNANSTMIANSVLKPWRFDEINVTRNPHFITLKPTALPCINQEVVLDHTLVDRLNSSRAERESTPIKGKNSVQIKNSQAKKQTKLPFVVLSEVECSNREVSLFEDPEITQSPIKNAGSPIKKRPGRILADVSNDSSKMEEISSRANIRKKQQTMLDYLNFDSTTDKENSPIKSRNEGPFRFSFRADDKKYQCKKKRIKAPVAVLSDEECSESEREEENIEENNVTVKLFEDLESTESLLEREQKMTKMKAKKYQHIDQSQKHVRKKDVRTKQEEEEAERWAQAFNSMCEEIDQHHLEIE